MKNTKEIKAGTLWHYNDGEEPYGAVEVYAETIDGYLIDPDPLTKSKKYKLDKLDYISKNDKVQMSMFDYLEYSGDASTLIPLLRNAYDDGKGSRANKDNMKWRNGGLIKELE